MNLPPYIGLHGVKHAGKDTVCERLIELAGPSVVRFSIADPLKSSVAALFDIDLDELEDLKNDPNAIVEVVGTGEKSPTTPGAFMGYTASRLTMRRFLEKYGTESHRDEFGEDFWLDVWRTRVQRMHLEAGGTRTWLHLVPGQNVITIVNTSVRFENEAEWIRENGGVIWQVIGTDEVEQAAKDAVREDGTPIPSETPLPEQLIDVVIDNSFRGCPEQCGQPECLTQFQYIDDQLATLISTGGIPS